MIEHYIAIYKYKHKCYYLAKSVFARTSFNGGLSRNVRLEDAWSSFRGAFSLLTEWISKHIFSIRWISKQTKHRPFFFGEVETFSDPGRSVMWEQIPGLWRLKQGRRQLFWQLLLLLWNRQLPPGGSWAQGGEKGGGGAGGWGGGGGSQRWRMKWREFMEAEEGGGGLILRWKVKMGRGGEGGGPSLRTSSTSSPTCSWRRWEVITLCEF